MHASEHFEANRQRDLDDFLHDDPMMIMMNAAAAPPEACMLFSRVPNIC